MSVAMQRQPCAQCRGTGRHPPGVCSRCRGAGWDPEPRAGDSATRRMNRIPTLALLSLLAFLALWALEFVELADLAGRDRMLASLVVATLFGWPALFALVRSVGAGAFGLALRPALIVLAPVVVMLWLRACGVLFDAGWTQKAAGLWLFAQLAVVPGCWALARTMESRERHRPEA